MKLCPLTLFHMATDVLANAKTENLDRRDFEVNADTIRQDVYDGDTGRLILSANLYPNRAIREILFPKLWLN